METIELLINNKNYKGTLKSDHEINLTQIDNKNYFEEWSKIKKEKSTYQDILADKEYKKVIQYICEKENGILSGCYPTLDDNSIIIHYDMKIGVINSKK
jgi:hypothetical protein